MIKVAIIDDSVKALEKLVKTIMKTGYDKDLSFECFAEGTEFVKYFIHNRDTAIVLMDIELLSQVRDGIFLARRIKKINHNTLVIFVSAHTEYFPEIVNAEPFRFIHKEHLEDIGEALDAAVRRIKEQNKVRSLKFKIGRMEREFLTDDIMYFSSADHKINITLANNESVSFYGRLDEIEKEIREINTSFLRVNKSYLVNTEYMTGINRKEIEINGKIIRFSDRIQYINKRM
ncbi:LytR/AlgR family response regulator transcription factor [Eisenbergiella porci]|uniref:LytR/AlgR family response regulator transcription factor n=1 Tax=Eisenbergiella porci TaxID=2652274 RepID=UPI002A807C97|nr:LytTR family DNA-binding domain-containing protein [Eisenbergiella porci]